MTIAKKPVSSQNAVAKIDSEANRRNSAGESSGTAPADFEHSRPPSVSKSTETASRIAIVTAELHQLQSLLAPSSPPSATEATDLQRRSR